MKTDELFALHELTLAQDDRELLADLRSLLKRFIEVEERILELTELSMLMQIEREKELEAPEEAA